MNNKISSSVIVQNYAQRITEKWRESVQNIIETAVVIKEAETNLSNFDYEDLLNALPMTRATVTKLLSIANNQYHLKETPSIF